MSAYSNRITGFRLVKASDLQANAKNWRKHPKRQADALNTILEQVGFVAPVIFNTATGRLVDGHLRQKLTGDGLIPVVDVELTEAEEAAILASFDPIAALAQKDKTLLEDVISSADTELQSLLASVNNSPLSVSVDEPPASTDPSLLEKWNVQPGQLWRIGDSLLFCGDSLASEFAHLVADHAKNYVLFCNPFYQDDVIEKVFSLFSSDHSVFLTGGKQLKDILARLDRFHEGVALGLASNAQQGNTARLMSLHKVIIWHSVSRLEFGLGYPSVIEAEGAAKRKLGDAYHHTTKPVDLCYKILLPFKSTGVGAVVDPFAGLGGSLLASLSLGWRWIGCEIEPLFVAGRLERASQQGIAPAPAL